MQKTRQLLLVAGLAVLAAALRLPLLTGSFWLDEAAQALESSRPFSQQLDIAPDFQPPFYHFVIHFALYISRAEWWLRLVGSVIPGVLSVVLTWWLGTKLGTKKVGLAAAVLLATSSLHVFFSQELRPYALPAFLGLVSWCGWWQLKLGASSKWWLGTWLTTVIGLYTSYLYPFLLIGQFVWWFLIAKNKVQAFKQIAFFGGGLVAAFAPWIPSFINQLRTGTELRVSLPGWESVVSTPQLKALPLVFAKFAFGVVDVEVTPLFVLGILLFVATLGMAGFALIRTAKKPDSGVLLLVCWLVVPLLTAWIISFFVPVLQPKRVLYLLPAFYIFLGSVLLWRNRIAAILLSLLLAINLLSLLQYYQQPRYQRENWRGAIEELKSRYPTNETVVVFSFDEPFAPWRWYAENDYQTIVFENYLINPDTARDQLEPITEYRYVVLFDYLRDLTDPQKILETEIRSFGYDSAALHDYPNLGFIRVFSRASSLVSQSML